MSSNEIIALIIPIRNWHYQLFNISPINDSRRIFPNDKPNCETTYFEISLKILFFLLASIITNSGAN